jgi:microcystin-dependent protein
MPFPEITITNAGLSAISTALGTGATLAFVKVTAGSGYPGSGEDPATFTNLKHYVMDATPTSINTAVLYQTTIRADLSSGNAPSTFKINEFGVWYSLGGAAPFLFGYTSTGDNSGDTLTPPISGASAIIKDYVLPVVYSRSVPVSTAVTLTPTVDLHSQRHLSSGIDPIPNANNSIGGLCPRTPGDLTQVLRGGPAAAWGPLPAHAPTHITGGSDIIPTATTLKTGLLPVLSGDPNTVLTGVGTWASGMFPGVVLDYAGGAAPSGFLLCDGQSYLTSSYPALFAVIGYAYGGSGTNFNVPDCRGRATVGAGTGPGLSARPLTAKFGEENHTLSTAEIPVHNHTLSDPGHAHAVYDPQHAHGVSQSPHAHSVADPGHAHGVYDPQHNHLCFFSTNADTGTPRPGIDSIPTWGYTDGGHDYSVQYGSANIWLAHAYTSPSLAGIGIYGSGTSIGIYGQNANVAINGAATGIGIYGSGTGVTIANAGSGGAHNNMPPAIVLNKIIKV